MLEEMGSFGVGDAICLLFFFLLFLLFFNLQVHVSCARQRTHDRRTWIQSFSYCSWGILVTLSIGSVYAWSTFNGPLTRALGVVAPSGSDWSLGTVLPIFSICACTLGVTTTTLGPWAERVGPRKVAMTAAVAWTSGLLTSAVGCELHSLPMVYFGYGVLGGIGWGLGYISPVSNLMKWFPDRRGLATGMALASFGGGAILAAPLNKYLCETFAVLPEYLGTVDEVSLITEEGRRYVESGAPDAPGALQEVVVASASDLMNFPGAQEGVYLVGTGDTGVVGCFLALGAIHFTAMSLGALIQEGATRRMDTRWLGGSKGG